MSQKSNHLLTGQKKLISLLLILFWISGILIFRYGFSFYEEMQVFFLPSLSINFLYLFYKLLLSLIYKPQKGEDDEGKMKVSPLTVSVVLPCYNESKESVLMAIDALIKQTYKIHEIIFVDDCSVDTSAYEGVCAFIKDHQGSYNGTKLVAHRQANQAGKRHAQIWGFKRATGDLLLLADSDGYLLPDAIEELVKVFSDEKVGSVVGYIGARNAKKNFLTAMQDMSYCSAFHVGRASQSMTNSVVVCSGALSMHRRHIVLEHLDEFGKEWVLKIHVKNGDDRRLTVISRKNGWKTKYQSTAVCYTDVPDTTDKFIKQRIRWSRSTYLCSIQNLITKPWKYLIYVIHSFLEAYLWLITFLVWFLFPRELNPTWAWGVQAFVYYILMCYISKVYYLFQNPIKYILSPIYSLVYGILTIYIRIRTFLVLFNYGWGTR